MRKAVSISLDPEAKQELSQLASSRRSEVRVAERAKIILLAKDGLQNDEIATRLGISRQKAGRWRTRYAETGLDGIIKDAPRRGRIPEISKAKKREIIERTINSKPPGRSQWSVRSMAEHMDVSFSTVARLWRAHGLKPHLVRTFKISNDPRFVEKLEDIVGLYLSPPENAIVLSCDEKSQIQALDRTQRLLPMKENLVETQTHDYKRNGTTSLFAALNTLTGQVIGKCMNKHTHKEWIDFLKLINKSTPEDKDIHIICDNYATHKHAKVQSWLRYHKRFKVHFTPTSASWLNMIERFFRDITVNRIRRTAFSSVKHLVSAIEEYLSIHNEKPKPFIWTASASDILEKVSRAKRSMDKLQAV